MSNSNNRVYNILLCLEENYTNKAIIECFQFRNIYKITLYDKNSKDHQKLKNDLFYDIYWLEYEDLDFEKLIYTNKKVLFNSYCIRKGLIRKAHIAYYIKKYVIKNPSTILVKCVPETYVFEIDYLDYLDEALNDVYEVENELKANEEKLSEIDTTKFILKSSLTNKGAEILIFDKRSQLEEYFLNRVKNLEDNDFDGVIDIREWVIQKYINNPLLLRKYKNRKFHLRVYVLAVGNIQVYVYEHILALFSLKEYDSLNFANSSLYSHITNTCVQSSIFESNSLFNESDCIKEYWSLIFDENDETCNQNIKNNIFIQIKTCVCELFKCLSCEKTVFQPLKNAFEIYGLDFLIDSQYNCYFLEANSYPDFKQTGDNLNNLIKTLFSQTITLSVDAYFDIQRVCDSSYMHIVYENKL